MREVARSALKGQKSERGGVVVSNKLVATSVEKRGRGDRRSEEDGMKVQYQLLEMSREIGVVVELVEVCWSVLVYPESHCECAKEGRSG